MLRGLLVFSVVLFGVTVIAFILFLNDDSYEIQIQNPFKIKHKPIVKRHTSVAVVFFGGRFGALRMTGDSIRKFVVEPHKMDVFVYGGEKKEFAEEQEKLVRKTFGKRLKYVYLGPQLFDRLGATKRMEQWPGYSFFKHCGNENFFHPGTINAFHSLQKGFEAMQQYEETHKFNYDFVLFVRPDMEWMAPFPPLSYFKNNSLYFATRTAWGGLPGGLTFGHRSVSHYFGNMFNRLEKGIIWKEVFKDRPKTKTQTQCGRNAESFVFLVINATVPYGWFSNVANIVCFSDTCKHGDLCTKPNGCKKGQRWKYAEMINWGEAFVAKFNAERINKIKWKKEDFKYRTGDIASYIVQRKALEKKGRKPPLWRFNANHPHPPWIGGGQ